MELNANQTADLFMLVGVVVVVLWSLARLLKWGSKSRDEDQFGKPGPCGKV